MRIESFRLDQLQLNPDNDRHGPLRDETSAIHWLLENRNIHMKALAADLANERRLFEPPLVSPGTSSHIVFDGNRRVCCLKLLLDPKLAPSAAWTTFFSELATNEVRNGRTRFG